jgi:chromosome partitioning protein
VHPDGEADGDQPDILPGRHSTAAPNRGKGAWLARYGLQPADLAGRIICVAAYKGGVGKTFLGYELAYMLGGILVDFEWDEGGATVQWGYNEDTRLKAPLLHALETGRVPRPLAGGAWRPDLVPGSKDFSEAQPTAEETAKTLTRWAQHWAGDPAFQGPLVVDTHPGGVPSTLGAMAASHVTVVPAPLKEREMNATVGMLKTAKSYPLLLIPNMVPSSPADRYINRLEQAAADAGAPIGPVISRHLWLESRSRRMAVTATDPVPKRAAGLVHELYQVAETVVSYARAAA